MSCVVSKFIVDEARHLLRVNAGVGEVYYALMRMAVLLQGLGAVYGRSSCRIFCVASIASVISVTAKRAHRQSAEATSAVAHA